MAEDEQTTDLRMLVGEVAAAYFQNSHVSPAEIPAVIQQIASSLSAIGGGAQAAEQPAETEEPAQARRATPAQVRKSITPDHLISFEDAKGYKTLKRHLSGRGLTPQQYREKHGLPKDYPMVAPSYSAARSAMAKSLGLGQMRKTGAAAKAKTAKPTGAKRGRPIKPKDVTFT